MPEYLAPGVYTEEVSFRSKSIEGVPTSTTGYAGLTRFGPVQYPGGPSSTEPKLITSFTEFERVYGGLEHLAVNVGSATAPDLDDTRLPFLAHAARAFFENGGKRLYVSRVFVAYNTDSTVGTVNLGVAFKDVPVGTDVATWSARWPGAYGNVYVETLVKRSKNLNYAHPTFGRQAQRVRKGAVVEIFAAPVPPAVDTTHVLNKPLTASELHVVDVDIDGRQTFTNPTTGAHTLTATEVVQLVEMQVQVRVDPETTYVYDELAADPNQKRFIGRILQLDDPEDETAPVWLKWEPAALTDACLLIRALHNVSASDRRLAGGNDGMMIGATDLQGLEADPDVATKKATGLEALGEIDDIAIVALPDGGTLATVDECFVAGSSLVSHAERLRYRIAVVDAPQASSMTEIRAFRGRFDSKYAAIYHPWIEILDPLERASQGAPPRRLLLPPSGFVTGIYARSDIERGVHKAPANEVVRGLTKFEANINKGRQDVLNPEGINALRFFEGRGNRVWGARTMSSDPEWKYVNVRRLFIYLEHSIDKGTQWAVFEPNNERLWANIKQTIEDFLFILWRDGALLGAKPEDAYFVRCDRTTMAQNDLDNGRLICLIGVAPTKPAEFVIFRIGQWTAGAKIN